MIATFRQMILDAETRHPNLKGHGERTASFAVAAAHIMGVSERRLSSLRIAAALHFLWGSCCEISQRDLVSIEIPEAPQAADFIRGLAAEWRMVPLEASILKAACRHDLEKIGVDCAPVDYRPGIAQALERAAKLVTPIDYVSQ